MDNAIVDKLDHSRRELLDLSGRNRLLNTPRSSSRSGRLEIVDELSEEVFRHLVFERKAMSFLPQSEEGEEDTDSVGETDLLVQPEDDETDDDGLAARHTDDRLQTRLTSKSLQKKLLKTFYDARTFEEEQGVNILYLALGFLKWYEADSSDRERQAPLILIPVKLDRRSANARFKLTWTEDEITTNLSLQEKLRLEFGVRLPDVSDVDDVSPNDYFAEVTKAISAQPRWELLPDDIVLWFFSFSKFLMYRDLQPESWPDHRPVEEHALLNALLKGGFSHEPPICGNDDNIDGILQPLDTIHVMDADSSQAVAVEEARRGRNLVIQGPPGTGKSQTITNLIANAAKDGKRVLFVAEKMAALDVVKRRLNNIGLGDMCLELHSNKSNKRLVLEELSRTLHLGRPKVGDVARHAEELQAYRDKLNRHAEVMHSYIEPAYVTPYQALGELVRLQAAGVKPADFKLVDALTWTAASLRDKEHMLKDLAIHMAEIGTPDQHPWRGVRLDAILPTDSSRISAQVATVIARIERLTCATDELAQRLEFGKASTPLDSSTLAQFGQRLANAPPMDRASIAHSAWGEQRSEIDALLQTGTTATESAEKLSGVVAEVAWSTDVARVRRDLAAYGKSLFRIFNGDYRRAQATLRGILVDTPPKQLTERVAILDGLLNGQKARQSVDNQQELGRCAFGTLWRGTDSEWPTLVRISEWESGCRSANIPNNFREIHAKLDDLQSVTNLVQRIAKDLKPMFDEINGLFKQLRLDIGAAFGVKDTRFIPLATLKVRLEAWQDDIEALTKWIAYYTRWRKLDALGMGELATRLTDGTIVASDVLDRFQMAYYEDIMREAFRQYPELAEFDGVSHDQVLERFKECDLRRLSLARKEVALAHYDGLPTSGGELGEIGIVRKEIKKKRKHLPVRKLLAKAGHAVQAIKPVFMMSPISIAQYLEPGVLEFDMLLIDEASQVRPVDALGAMARVKQVIVVGDDKQMPPTKFFSRVIGDDDDDSEDDDFQAGDLESILGLCEAQSMPQRMLQWHYRSRHQSLIAVSNHEFYDDRLFVVPSPHDGGGQLGLKFRHVPKGVFDRGGAANNRVEATAIADAVMKHARERPDKSLGIGAFSVSQKDAILDEIELRRRSAPELEPFFATGGAEPFFVKNLENIQGDERDVIFISVGYGRDASGFMSMGFGPLSNDGGERRLNVLISRAKERCEVFASITADDLDLNRAKSRGAAALKTFLTYAEKGFLDVGVVSERGFDSDFERQVAKALTGHGYQVESQIGVAGFYVDLAIVDPESPGRYVLGIECDGASYHSSRSARDRDRLRQQVLEDRGWVIHRIWSTDWFHRPDEQLRKVVAAVEDAKASWAARDDAVTAVRPRIVETPDEVERHDQEIDLTDEGSAIETVSYVEANFPINSTKDIHELPTQQLVTVVVQIVKTEGPIHQDEVARRTASLWGKRRTGARIADAVEAALSEAFFNGQVLQEGLFFSPSGQDQVLIRNRENVESSNLRKPEYLPPTEIRAALVSVVQVHLGVEVDEALIEASRLFGFRAASSQLKEVMRDEVRQLIGDRVVEERNGKLYSVSPETAEIQSD